ncbi:MAG: Gfo/Idh/MocA family oxidoreductase [Myxococcota bacterium]
MARVQRLKWAIVGAGVAGRARARAIADDPRAPLVSVWRGKHAGELGVPEAESFEAAIAEADAVAICSPSEVHAEQALAAIRAGKHALVEFPLARDRAEGEALVAAAAAADRVLHVEHIELLDVTSMTLSAHIRPEMVKRVEVGFDRPGAQETTPEGLALGNVARLHRVAAIAGGFASVDRVAHEPGLLTAELTLQSGAPLRATFRQAPYYARRTTLDLQTLAGRWTQEDGHLARDGMPVTLVGLGGLFSRDQLAATARILDGAKPYVDDERILHVLDTAARIGRGQIGPVPAPSRSDRMQ